MTYRTRPAPELTVGDDNKQGWNQPAQRRHGFHNAHHMFRRSLSFRAGHQVVLDPAEDADLAGRPEVALLTGRSEFSALVVAQGDKVVLSRHAADFPEDQPHSIQSISKMLMHLVAGRMISEGQFDTTKPTEHYLPDIGSGYRGATVQDVLDMNVINHFSEDYYDPQADCYAEEEAMGWRLPPNGAPEPLLREFICGITGDDLHNPGPEIRYSSANTEVLTLICDQIAPGTLPDKLHQIVEAAGFAHPFHISTSRDAVPGFSGGGCLTVTDLARFGLLLARVAMGQETRVGNPAFTRATLTRPTRHMPAPRDHIRYSDHVMTDGRWIGHSGYGGQFLMVDLTTGTVCAYLSVIENASGFSHEYMAETIANLAALLPSAG